MSREIKVIFLSGFFPEILSYGLDFRIWLTTAQLYFRVGNTRYTLSTSEKVFHIVFTLSAFNKSHCYLNGTNVDCPSYSRIKSGSKERVFVVRSAENRNYTISDLFLWPSEMSHEQVLAEYQGIIFEGIWQYIITLAYR